MSLALTQNSRVILIGVPETTDLEPIPHAARAVHRFKKILMNAEIVGISADQIYELPEPDRPDVGQVMQDVRRICQEAKDSLLFYYCGHGLYGDEQSPLYLTLAGSSDTDKQVNAIRISDVKSQMAQSSAKTRIMILDCCYSGAALEGTLSSENDMRPAIALSGTYAMASVPPNDKARFIEGDDYPIFSGQLFRVLEHGLEGAGEHLTIDEVFEHARDDVAARNDVAVPIKEVRVTADDLLFAKNVWAKSSDVVREILSSISRLTSSVSRLTDRVGNLENAEPPLPPQSEERNGIARRQINQVAFLLILSVAVGLAAVNQIYGIISLRAFFVVSLLTAFISAAPSRALDGIMPNEISRPTLFWACLLSACILGSVDKQLEADLAKLVPFLSSDDSGSQLPSDPTLF